MGIDETLRVDGMTCGGCENSVRTGLLQIEGVDDVRADHRGKTVEVRFDPDRVQLVIIRERIEELGFSVMA